MRIAVIGGDGTGPEVVAEGLKVLKAVSQKVGANPELMVLRKVVNAFGSHAVRVTAYAYSSKELLMATEPTYVKVREGMMQKPEKKKKSE